MELQTEAVVNDRGYPSTAQLSETCNTLLRFALTADGMQLSGWEANRDESPGAVIFCGPKKADGSPAHEMIIEQPPNEYGVDVTAVRWTVRPEGSLKQTEVYRLRPRKDPDQQPLVEFTQHDANKHYKLKNGRYIESKQRFLSAQMCEQLQATVADLEQVPEVFTKTNRLMSLRRIGKLLLGQQIKPSSAS